MPNPKYHTTCHVSRARLNTIFTQIQGERFFSPNNTGRKKPSSQIQNRPWAGGFSVLALALGSGLKSEPSHHLSWDGVAVQWKKVMQPRENRGDCGVGMEDAQGSSLVWGQGRTREFCCERGEGQWKLLPPFFPGQEQNLIESMYRI